MTNSTNNSMLSLALPTIRPSEAESIRNAHLFGETANQSRISTETIGDGRPMRDSDLQPLVDALEEVKSKFKVINNKTRGVIDAEVVEQLHSYLSSVSITEHLNEDGFWLWFSNMACNGYFCRFIAWRHKVDGDPKNWGLPKVKMIEAYFPHLWIRGQMMYDPNERKGAYYYAKLGSCEVWRSQILRQDRFNDDLEFVKALLDTICGNIPLKVGKGSKLRTVLMKGIGKKIKKNELPKSDYQRSYLMLQEILGRSVLGEEIEQVHKEVESDSVVPTDLAIPDAISNDDLVETLLIYRYRKKQSRFREDVLNNCRSACIITGEPYEPVIEACHIWDVRFKGTFTIENGLAMKADFHKLFDRGDMLINSNHVIELNAKFPKSSIFKDYEGKKAYVPSNINQDFLNWKYEIGRNRQPISHDS